jgi:iron complex transport system substrate-binding protein
VLFAVMPSPLTVAGPDTLVGDLLVAAGARNVVPPGANRYPTWGIESLLPVDPDFIVLSPHTGLPDPGDVLADWPELTAVREGRIISVDPDWVHRPGPRLKLGLRALAEAFHGINLSLPENQP